MFKKSAIQKWKKIYRNIIVVADERDFELRRAISYGMKILK